MKTVLLIIIALLPLFAGCATHTNHRVEYSPEGKKLKEEKTRWKFVAIDSSAASVQVSTKDGEYERTVNASEPSSQSDEETAGRIASGVAAAVFQALNPSTP